MIEIHRDEKFLQTALLKAENFYFKNYLNALYKAVIAEELNDKNNTENLEDCESLSNSEDEEILFNQSFTGTYISNTLNK